MVNPHMDRRKFLKIGAAGAAAATAFPDAFVSALPLKKKASAKDGFIREPSREIPVVASYDVLVAGGGPSGVAAAICAAREGASVLLVERYSYLGGLWTGGLILPVLSTHGLDSAGGWTRCMAGFFDELCGKLFDMGMAVNPLDPTVDPEAAKYVMEQMIQEAGVQMVYNAMVAQVVNSGDRIDAAVLETKSGRLAVRAKVFVDASGDGDLIAFCGESFDKMNYHIGAMWRVGGLDPSFRRASGATPIPGVRLMHLHGEDDKDGLDAFENTRVWMRQRKAMWEKTQALRNLEGGENAFLLETPSQIGVRVTRMLEAVKRLSLEETLTGIVYPDVIGMSGGSDTINFKGRKITKKERPIWQIPYRSLVPKRVQNLIVAGRCFGFERELAWDAREIGTCFVTGQAAGVAAALAVNSRDCVRDINIPILQETLRRQGALLEI